MIDPKASPRRTHRGAPLWILVAVVFFGIAGTFAALSFTHEPSGTLTDLKGNRVALDPGDAPNPQQQAAQKAIDSGDGRFIVPSVGLDVPLGALNVVDGVITPPGFTSVYRVRNYGVPVTDAAAGTVFLVTHSLRGGGEAPGNYLIDMHSGKATVRSGATIEVDGVEYVVDSSQTVRKTDVAYDSKLWADVPNRLVVFTCLQVPSGAESVDNMIITATRADASAKSNVSSTLSPKNAAGDQPRD